jgi:copper chaperone
MSEEKNMDIAQEILYKIKRRRCEERLRRSNQPKNGVTGVEKTMLNVEGMSCEHCVKAVEGSVSVLPGVTGVLVDLTGKTVSLQYDPAQTPLDKIKSEIEDQGYEVVG